VDGAGNIAWNGNGFCLYQRRVKEAGRILTSTLTMSRFNHRFQIVVFVPEPRISIVSLVQVL